MAVLRVAHVWGDRLLEVAHLTHGALGPVSVREGEVRLDGAVVAVEPGRPKAVEWGGTRFLVAWAEPVARVKPKASEEVDWRFPSLVVCLLLFGAATVALFRLEVAFFGGESDDLFGADLAKYRKVLTAPPPPEHHQMAEATRAAQKEGQAGKPDEKRARSSSTPRKLDVQRAGLLGALEDLGAAKDVLAGGMSEAVNQGLGNLQGPQAGDAHGLGGMGPRGNGPGGGGPPGPGGFGARLTRGPGKGFGPQLSGKGDEGPGGGHTVVSDGLSRDVVAKVIRRHEKEIKFCYEQALQHTPGLKGKVTVLFVIGPSGDVVQADVAESSLKNDEAESCVAARVRRWKFPEPAGGGVVSVTHPWIFSEAGAD